MFLAPIGRLAEWPRPMPVCSRRRPPMQFLSPRVVLTLLFLVGAACAPATTPRAGEAPSGGGPASGATGQPSRTLVIAIRTEPASLASKQQASGVTLTTTKRLFNAELTIFDQRGQAQPYLAAELPRLQTSSWQVLPDGRMETTYKLKPNLVWQDGAPLTADDFFFASRVYATPELGTVNAPPTSLIEEVVATDRVTLTIRWKRSYAQAG